MMFYGELIEIIHHLSLNIHLYMSRFMRKPFFMVSDQVKHKQGCTDTGDGLMLEVSDLVSRGIELSM